MTGEINSFSGEHRFLSNFYPCTISLYAGDEVYRSVEHAYQAIKFKNPQLRFQIREAPSPGCAKRLGQEYKQIREHWDDIKVPWMLKLLRKKFVYGSHLAQCLLNTEDAMLTEGNYWGDRFWGVYEGKGENHLGKLLMMIRKDLRKK